MAVSTRFLTAGLSDTGRKRDNNEDRFHCDPERGIFLVVDGMGGQNAGEKAAETAISVMQARLERATGTAIERVREAITLANNEIYRLSHSNPEWAGMACVLTVAVVEEDRATVGHVGDSRLYLLSPGEIRKITHDHSPVGEREDSGELPEKQAMMHPRRNEVFRDVGSAEHTPDDPDFIEAMTIPFRPDQAILLCSDGLSDLVTSGEIRQLVERNASNPAAAASALIDAANRAGGKDNVTVLLIANSRYPAAVGVSTSRPVETGTAYVETSESKSWVRSWLIPVLIGVVIGALIYAMAVRLLPLTKAPLPTNITQAVPHTWTVSAADGDGATISAVLDKAHSGDTVLVAPGRYGEQVNLREGVNLISLQPQGAILESTLGDAVVVGQNLKNGRMSGFRIGSDAQHLYGTGVLLRDANVELDDLEISGARTAAIELRGTSAPVLRGNRLAQNPGAGVLMADGTAPRLIHNLITRNGNGERAKQPGIAVHDSAVPTLIANTISDNAGGPIWATKSAAAAIHLEDNFFGPAKKGPPRQEIRIIPQ